MRFSLRSKMLLLIAAVSLIPLILFASLGIYLVNLTQQYAISRLETQLLAQKEKEIEKFFVDTLTLFHLQVAYPVAALSGVPADQRESLLKWMSKTNKHISGLSFLEYDASYPDKPEIGMELNKLADGEPVSELKSQASSAEFQKAVSGRDYIGSVRLKGDDYFITIASSVKNNDEVVIGVLAGEVSLAPVSRAISDGVLGSSGYLILSDDKGEIWAKPQRLEYSGFNSNVYVQSVLGGYMGAGLATQDEYDSSFGGTVVAGGKKIKDLNWALVVEWPKEDAYSVVYSLIRQAGIFLFLILGVTVLSAYFLGRRIIEPITALGKGAKIIGEGNLDHRINIGTKDELEELAGYFNEMAKNLKEIEVLKEAKARLEGLARSLEKEKELSQIKDKFITTASHQLRTPISVIRWTAESLKDMISGLPPEEIRVQLETVYKNAEALALVIGDILTVAELGIGYKPEEGAAGFSLKSEAKEVLGTFQKDMEAKNLEITFNAPDDECLVKASSVNIKRVLNNLIDNAITYTKENGKIIIELNRQDNQVMFSIKDTGIGIPADDQKFIFNEFFRARNAVEMKNVGTGLGLFIVKTIIDGHKGKIGFESSSAGSRFWFSLPETKV